MAEEEITELVFRSKEDRAKDEREDEPVGAKFKFRLPDDDFTYVATRPRKTVLSEALASITARRNNAGDTYLGMREFLERVLEPSSWSALDSRLLDDEDYLDNRDLAEIFNHIVKTMWQPTGRRARR